MQYTARVDPDSGESNGKKSSREVTEERNKVEGRDR